MTDNGSVTTRRRRGRAVVSGNGNGHVSGPHPPWWPEVVRPRAESFQAIRDSIADAVLFSSPMAIVAEGDSLALLRRLPDHSVSLILTDPPYHATKKRNIAGDTAFSNDQEYVAWMEQYSNEWRRVLKLNGTLCCFCDSSMAARLDVMFSKNFNMLNHVVWTKPNDPGFDGWQGKMKKTALRQWYQHSERILVAEQAVEGNLFRSGFAKLLNSARVLTGLSMKDVTGAIGAHGRVNHGGAVSNWEDGRNTPSREQYEGMVRVFMESGKVAFMPPYEDAIRVFCMDGEREFKDVWDFPSVRPYDGKHPAEKPLDMLNHVVEATTLPGDIVLDCFAGSGNSALSALGLGRRAVAIELAPEWAKRIATKVAR